MDNSDSVGASTLQRFLTGLIKAGVNVLTLLVAVTIGTYYLARWVGLNQFWLFTIIGHVLPWLFLPVVILLPAAIFRRSRLFQLLVVVFVTLFTFTYGHLYLPRWSVDAVGPEFTAMSYNVRSSNGDAGAVTAVILSQSPDFFVLRELEPGMASALESLLANEYLYHRIETGSSGFWSRYEIMEYETWQLSEDNAYWAQRLSLNIEGRKINVVGVHLRYAPVLQGVQLYGSPLVIPVGRAEGTYTDVHNLLERLEEVDGPLIVMGDFNMTDQQDLYTLVTQRLCDAHRESGWGMGFTQAPLHGIELSMLRIDYVFYSPDLVSLSTEVGRYGGSDHRPVVARLAWSASR